VPRQPLYVQEVTIPTATGGCVSRSEVVVSPLGGTAQLISVPVGDTTVTWIGIKDAEPDRPAGEVLSVFTGTMSVAPATEGVSVPSVEMAWPLCAAGPSQADDVQQNVTVV
jgi:hypothetical protein